jgi:60 kDa SS-A/Ro ribonucleoprotein
MARYNTKSVTPTVTNHQGGTGYALDAKTELISILATGLDNKFYEKLGEREQRLANVIADVAKSDTTFVAKAMIYARTVMGQRTVTHFGAVQLAKHLAGNSLGSKFFSKRARKANAGGIIFRLDDMLEIAACYKAINPGKSFSNAIKKGFKDALESADEYELAKYQAKNKDISLVDIVNLVHPKPTAKMVDVFAKLMKGELKQFNTVEDKNTKAGQEIAAKVKSGEITKAEAEIKLNEAKEDNYAELISTRKIGYLALLRNLRNILKTGGNAELVKNACELLTDAKLIKQSLVFPHQIDLALEVMLDEFGASGAKPFITALNTAYELAIPNLTELFTNGRTAVVFDSSGSMSSRIVLAGGRKGGSEDAIAKAALIAATLAKGINADVYHFADSCQSISYNPLDTVNTLKKRFLSKQGAVGYGTSFDSIARTLGNKYDRVFVISDMQGRDHMDRTSLKGAHIYSVDLCGYGTTMFKPGNKTYGIYGYGADIYELIKKVEIDPKALIKEIEAIQI